MYDNAWSRAALRSKILVSIGRSLTGIYLWDLRATTMYIVRGDRLYEINVTLFPDTRWKPFEEDELA